MYILRNKSEGDIVALTRDLRLAQGLRDSSSEDLEVRELRIDEEIPLSPNLLILVKNQVSRVIINRTSALAPTLLHMLPRSGALNIEVLLQPY